jgi:hypothetical protein
MLERQEKSLTCLISSPSPMSNLIHLDFSLASPT